MLIDGNFFDKESALVCHAKNKDKFHTYIRGGIKLLTPDEEGYREDKKRYLIDKPAAKLRIPGLLHPACLMNLYTFNEIDELPGILGLRFEEELQARIQCVIDDDDVRSFLTDLWTLDDWRAEAAVELAFAKLVDRIIKVLKSMCVLMGEKRPYCVGGIVADELCAVSGVTDYYVMNENRDIALVTECKPVYVHPFRHKFYKGNVGIQLFGAFYCTNLKPTFLYTQKHFVLLVKSGHSGRHMKFPTGIEKCRVDSIQFLKAIAICLLASSRGINPKKATISIETVPIEAGGQAFTIEKVRGDLHREYDFNSVPSFSLSDVPKTSAENGEDDDDLLPLTAYNLQLLNDSFRKSGVKI